MVTLTTPDLRSVHQHVGPEAPFFVGEKPGFVQMAGIMQDMGWGGHSIREERRAFKYLSDFLILKSPLGHVRGKPFPTGGTFPLSLSFSHILSILSAASAVSHSPIISGSCHAPYSPSQPELSRALSRPICSALGPSFHFISETNQVSS